MSFDLKLIRQHTQVLELLTQGITLKNTFKEMEPVWESLYTPDKRCVIVEQEASKVKYQAVNLYTIKLIKYINSIVGLDLVPLAQQNVDSHQWITDLIILNVASNKIKDHYDLYVKLLVNLFGVSEDIIEIAFNPSYETLETYLVKTYGIGLTNDEALPEPITIEFITDVIEKYLDGSSEGIFKKSLIK